MPSLQLVLRGYRRLFGFYSQPLLHKKRLRIQTRCMNILVVIKHLTRLSGAYVFHPVFERFASVCQTVHIVQYVRLHRSKIYCVCVWRRKKQGRKQQRREREGGREIKDHSRARLCIKNEVGRLSHLSPSGFPLINDPEENKLNPC